MRTLVLSVKKDILINNLEHKQLFFFLTLNFFAAFPKKTPNFLNLSDCISGNCIVARESVMSKRNFGGPPLDFWASKLVFFKKRLYAYYSVRCILVSS